MKRIALIPAFLLFWFTACFAQELQVLTPTIGEIANFSAQAKKEFARRNALASKSNLTKAEEEELMKLWDKYPETQIDLYGTIDDGASWYDAGGPTSVKASSQLPKYKTISYDGKKAHDFSLKTAWVEGDKTGYGIGEYIEYRFPNQSPRVSTVIIYNGYVKSKTSWQNNSRVKQLRMWVNGTPYAMLDLKDTRAQQSFKLPKVLGKRADKQDLMLRFEIVSIYAGKKYKDTAISELYFDGVDVY